MKRKNWPAVGTKMYFVVEHRYYIPDHAAPMMEYCVCEGEVTGYFTLGYTEMHLVGSNPDGFTAPSHYKVKEIGEKVFFTPREAALLAKHMTKKYEQAWGWMGNPPMRRPWIVFLDEGQMQNLNREEESRVGELLGYKYPSFRAAAEDCSLLQPFFYSCLSRLTG